MQDLQTTGMQIADIRKRVARCEQKLSAIYIELISIKEDLKSVNLSVLDEILTAPGTFDFETGKEHPLNDED